MSNKGMTLAGIVMVALLASSGELSAQKGIGINAAGSYAGVFGAEAEALSGGFGGEGSVFYQMRELRFGAGGSYYSIGMDEPFSDLAWSRVNIFGLFAYQVTTPSSLLPYLSVRVGWVQFSPDQQLVIDNVSGLTVAGVGGTEIAVADKVAIDVSVLLENFSISDADLSGVNLETVAWGFMWGIRAGVTVKP